VEVNTKTGLRIGGSHEHKAAAYAGSDPDGLVGAQFPLKIAVSLRVASPQKWLDAHAGSPACSLSCEVCSGEDAGWLRLPWVR